MPKLTYKSNIDGVSFYARFNSSNDRETATTEKFFARTDGTDTYVSSAINFNSIVLMMEKPDWSIKDHSTIELHCPGLYNQRMSTSDTPTEVVGYNRISEWASSYFDPGDVLTLRNPYDTPITSSNADNSVKPTHPFKVETIKLPSDITTNLVSGSHSVYGQATVIAFHGAIKKGDTITLTRAKHNPTVNVYHVDRDCASMADMFTVADNDTVSIEYLHAGDEPSTPPTPKKYEIKIDTENFNTVTAPEKTGNILDGFTYYVTDSNKTITIKTVSGKIFSTAGTFVANGTTYPIPATNTDTVTYTIPANAILTGENKLTISASDKPQPSEVTFTSSDPNASWATAKLTGGTGLQNTVKVLQGSQVSYGSKFAINVIDKSNQTHGYNYTLSGALTYDSPLTLNLPDLTDAKTVDIPKQVKLIQQSINANIQNADIIVPKGVEDDYGKMKYYVDRDNRTITVKAHTGYLFNTDGSLSYTNYTDSLDEQTIIIKATQTDTVTVTLPTDFDPSSTVTLTIGATKQAIVENTGGFVNLYKADYNSLVEFSNDWIGTISDGNLNIYDVASYVSNLVMLPLDVPEKLVNAKSGIVAGNRVYKTEMPTVDDTHYIYDLGSISTPEQYQNGFDYYQVTTRLVLPFTDTVELKPIHVINKTIAIKYDVQFQTGDTTVILSNEDGTFFTKSFNIANQVPFVTASTNGKQYAVINKLQERFNNGVHQAYILIEQPTPVLNNDYYSTVERGQLKAYNGNVKAELLNNANVPSNEFNALQVLLRNGVKIK